MKMHPARKSQTSAISSFTEGYIKVSGSANKSKNLFKFYLTSAAKPIRTVHPRGLA
jgi:hypothetical protein